MENIITGVILLLAPNFCHLLPTGRMTFIGSHAAVCDREKPPLLLNTPTLPAPQRICQIVRTVGVESLQGRMVRWLVCVACSNSKYGNKLQADFTPVTYRNDVCIFLLLLRSSVPWLDFDKFVQYTQAYFMQGKGHVIREHLHNYHRNPR